jgi:adenosine deaminase
VDCRVLDDMATAELHRHLEAGLSPETIARLAERHGVTEAATRGGRPIEGLDPQDPASIRRYYRGVAAGFQGAAGFSRFVDSFGLPLSVLRSLEDLEQAVVDELLDCAAAGSLHTELRGSPFTYRDNVRASLDEIAAALVNGVDRAWREHRASGTFILAFSRQKGLGAPEAGDEGRQAPVVASLAARFHRPDRPVGLDIAGFPETAYPPALFEDALAPAREAGVPLTVHAGEQGTPPDFAGAPPALILEAVERLGARRIGHGTSLAASPAARVLLRERGVGVECCPISNDRLGFVPLAAHPLPLLMADGLLASLGTDDPLMVGPFSVAETFDEIAGVLGLGHAALAQLTANAVETAFVTPERRQMLRVQLQARGAAPRG